MSRPHDKKLDRDSLEKVARVFSAFSDATRLAILQELMSGSRTVGELVEEVGGSQGNVSRQLAMLHEAGLLNRSKEGNRVSYSIADEMVNQMCELVCEKLNRDSRESREITFQI